MNSVRYVGLDVHRDTISAAVLNESGRMIQQSILATRAAAILDFIGGMRGTARHLRGRNPFGLALRSAATARGQAGGMQPTHELAAEVGQQERCDRCAQAG